MKVHVKNISEGIAFFAPLNRNLRPHEIVDVLAMCEGNEEMALKLVASYDKHPSFQVFRMHNTPASPEGEAQAQAAEDAGHEPPPVRKANFQKKGKL